MYYPVGWHQVLRLSSQSDKILSVQANQERELFFVLTTNSIHVWNPRPAVEIVAHKRSNESLKKIGDNRSAVWRADSSTIVVATDKDQLLFYQLKKRFSYSGSHLSYSASSAKDSLYRLRHDAKKIKNFIITDMSSIEPEYVPALTIFSFGKLDLSSIGLSCIMSAEEELIVGARNGEFYGVHWDGSVDEKFPWSIPKDFRRGLDYITDLKFSSILSGFVMVFHSGRVGFMPLKSSGKSGSETKINYLVDVKNAVCAEINHRYKLAAFGLENSKVVVCNISDLNSSLIVNHELEVFSGKFPRDLDKLGSVKCMRYSPDSSALAVSWENSDFAIWSVFGALLFSSQQWQSGSQTVACTRSLQVSSLAWGREGHNLWLSLSQDDIENAEANRNISLNMLKQTETGTSNSLDIRKCDEIIIMSVAHTTLSSSSSLTCSSDSIILLSDDRVFIGPSVPHKADFDNWYIVDIPQTYLNTNYPIRYATVDRQCRNIALAGYQGFALYSIGNSSWNHFSKKSQESGFSVCGDLIWWKDYLVLSCFNSEKECFEIRAFLTTGTLDNELSVTLTIPMEICRMSIFENRLLVLYSDGTLSMFMLNLRKHPVFKNLRSNSIASSNGVSLGGEHIAPDISRPDSATNSNYSSGRGLTLNETSLQISPIKNLVISNLQANAYCISSIALTRLHFKNNRLDDSILLNVCGKLFLLEREVNPEKSIPSSCLEPLDLNGLSLNEQAFNDPDVEVSSMRLSDSIHLASTLLKNTTDSSALSNVTFKAVSVIATNVEQFWISPEIPDASDMSYFRKSLWLFCGGLDNQLHVWLPLLNDKNDPPNDLYVPDRIMLPIRCDIYPLAIRSSAPNVIGPDDAIVLGAESDVLFRDSGLFTYFPYCTVKRQCRVYLHRILRELLLNQHLGYYARKIAESCQSLPYFAHCFELLLHEVLEEEATSAAPLPDPMLPQIVRFIKEFPVYLETVVHCARKSELSMWSYLFDERAVGNPRRLFQECLEKRKLETAASCLIILQGLDRNIVSNRMVKELIKAAREDSKYNYLIEDLDNFLSRAEIDCRESPK